jgi:hypothetical protein
MASGRLLALAAAGSLALAGAAAAQDGDPRVPASGPAARPPLLLNLTTPRVESPERALEELVREEARAPRRTPAGDVEVLPDGSVRIGRARISVTVKDDCPEEPHILETVPRPLPGRARR